MMLCNGTSICYKYIHTYTYTHTPQTPSKVEPDNGRVHGPHASLPGVGLPGHVCHGHPHCADDTGWEGCGRAGPLPWLEGQSQCQNRRLDTSNQILQHYTCHTVVWVGINLQWYRCTSHVLFSFTTGWPSCFQLHHTCIIYISFTSVFYFVKVNVCITAHNWMILCL